MALVLSAAVEGLAARVAHGRRNDTDNHDCVDTLSRQIHQARTYVCFGGLSGKSKDASSSVISFRRVGSSLAAALSDLYALAAREIYLHRQDHSISMPLQNKGQQLLIGHVSTTTGIESMRYSAVVEDDLHLQVRERDGREVHHGVSGDGHGYFELLDYGELWPQGGEGIWQEIRCVRPEDREECRRLGFRPRPLRTPADWRITLPRLRLRLHVEPRHEVTIGYARTLARS